MITQSLEIFINRAVTEGEISRRDVLTLQNVVLPNGIGSRDEADLLIALDRAVPEKDAAWNAFVIQAVVDYVVWASRPTGYIDQETALWLTGSLGCGRGPTDVAAAIAFEIVREAERSDEVLIAFVMRWAGGLYHGALIEDAACGLV